jgi:hypothetical protein
MTEKCELLETCGFFKKYQESWSVACKNLISKYCMGPNMAEGLISAAEKKGLTRNKKRPCCHGLLFVTKRTAKP